MNLTSSRTITNVSSALSGTMPGLNVRQGSGIPGADGATLRLRGVGSLNAGQDPLILLMDNLAESDKLVPMILLL